MSVVICFEIPTNKPAEFAYIKMVANSAKNFAFSVCLNGDDFSESDELSTDNLQAFFYKPAIRFPCISMMELRKAAAERAGVFNPSFRIISDGNFEYGKGWEKYVRETCEGMMEFSKTSNCSCVVNMDGVLGSSSSKGGLRIPMNPMFQTSRGIIYRSEDWLWDCAEILPSGFEDYYASSLLVRRLNCIPLKRFLSPIKHPMKRWDQYDDAIHDRDVWRHYNLKLVRDLWGDPDWNLPKKHKHIQRRGMIGEYFMKQPRKSFQYMCEIRDRFINGSPEMQRYAIAGYEDFKWRSARKANDVPVKEIE